ncbi:MAE_28990/MAE_18760 family HEPN-like nuclease [Trichococcus shcherbakoviae]|uniref:RiboL-PSP-HEPN domain-containing protein n=1 Tax=Trichococcus shcherbakoviae TaxID=2094020 RepID=A0A383TI00_9LACT|nr:HEPN domain-containing protein [Trichococcus shcherbakoviae]SYZ79269.1 Hypothetical protein TART1_2096 [Trichococcus shcherbakoviae]
MQSERDFTNYRTEKREEISTMARIIDSMPEEFTEREKDLLLRSFIVLVYAYWESCYHRVQEVVFEKYQDSSIKNLPFAIKNKVYLYFALDKAGTNGSKTIREIDNYSVFQKISSGILETEDKKLSEHVNQTIKASVLNKSGNPTFQQLNNFMHCFNINMDKVVNNNINEGYLAPYFIDFLDFIIKQRNAIAHKNEKIQYTEKIFNTYFECIDHVTLVYSEKYQIQIDFTAPDFIKEMLFQIDRVFTFLIESVDEKRRLDEVHENDNN